jgi:integrase
MLSLRRFLEKAGLPADVRFHDLRHTAGTLALKQGVPLHTVSKMLGHSDLAMTRRHYAHVAEAGSRERSHPEPVQRAGTRCTTGRARSTRAVSC